MCSSAEALTFRIVGVISFLVSLCSQTKSYIIRSIIMTIKFLLMKFKVLYSPLKELVIQFYVADCLVQFIFLNESV